MNCGDNQYTMKSPMSLLYDVQIKEYLSFIFVNFESVSNGFESEKINFEEIKVSIVTFCAWFVTEIIFTIVSFNFKNLNS